MFLEPVDVVFTWVDPTHQEWQEEKWYWERKILNKITDENAVNLCRYSSFDEIRFGLRSVAQYLPWVRHIFLVTNHASFPKWLDVHSKKITIVDYRTLLPESSLPTYNSNAIEAFLHLIPGLSEHFIYFNDDLLLLQPLQPDDFIDPKSKKLIHPLESDFLFKAFQKNKFLTYLEDKFLKFDSHVIKPRFHTMQELNIPYDGHSTAHCPKILSKTQCGEFSSRFKKQIDALLETKFRTSTNFTYLEALCHYNVKKIKAAFFTEKYLTRIISILDYRFANKYQIGYTKLKLKKYTYLAIEDARSHIDVKEEERFKSFLSYLYPSPAVWELENE